MISSLNVNFILHSITKRQSIAIISDKTVKIDILTTFIIKDAAMGVCYAMESKLAGKCNRTIVHFDEDIFMCTICSF